MTDRELIQQALDAMLNFPNDISDEMFESIRSLRARLAQPEQEPVAWRYALDASVEGPRWIYIDKDPHQWLNGPAMVGALIEPLYTAPPQREFIGLTDEEISAIDWKQNETLHDFARAIEAKLREKNND